MDERTAHALVELAEKLGTTSEYLWAALLRQAPIAGLLNLIVSIMWVAGAVWWFRFVRKKTTEPGLLEHGGHQIPEWDDGAGVALAWASVFAFSVIVPNIVGDSLPLIVAGLVNPEYWALRQILGRG